MLVAALVGCAAPAASNKPAQHPEATQGEQSTPSWNLAPADAQLHEVDSPPQAMRTPRPQHSMTMVENRVSGLVSVQILVGRDGRVVDVKVTKDLGFDSGEVTAEAVRQYEFIPAQKNGEPVSVWIGMNVQFPSVNF
jgi:hypothetical protein